MSKKIHVLVRQLYTVMESLGFPILFRKIYGILGALDMQVEDGPYDPQAIVHLCRALLVTVDVHDIPEPTGRRIKELVSKISNLIEKE